MTDVIQIIKDAISQYQSSHDIRQYDKEGCHISGDALVYELTLYSSGVARIRMVDVEDPTYQCRPNHQSVISILWEGYHNITFPQFVITLCNQQIIAPIMSFRFDINDKDRNNITISIFNTQFKLDNIFKLSNTPFTND